MLRYGAPPLGLGCGRVLCVVIGSRQTGPLSHTVVILEPYDWAVPGRDWALECFVVAAFSRLLVWLFFRLPRLPSHFAGLLVRLSGACAGRRGWLSPLPGTAFRRWVLWVPPVSPPALARSAFVVRLVSRIARWEEIEKLPFSTALSAFGTLELAQVLVLFLLGRYSL